MKPLSDTFDVESIFTSRFNLEFQRYLQTKDPPKTCSRLEWWDSHKTEFPLLANCARHILAIPASSATSERFFSAGGLMVSSKRTNLAEDTVEDLLMIKLNLEKVENLEKMGGGKRKLYTMEEDLDLEGEVEVFHKKTRLVFDSDSD